MSTQPEETARLKEAMEKIKPILAEYDCGAIVLLASPKAMEYFYAFTPSWALTQMIEVPGQGMVLRVRSKRSDFHSLEAQKAATEATVGLFAGFAHLLAKVSRDMEGVVRTVGKHLNFSTWSKEL